MYIPELLSPVGDFECLKAAVQNGADAVYFGAGNFNARARATNFSTDEELKKAISYAKTRGVKVNLTLNTLIKNEEFEDAINLAIRAHNFGADALIIQDLGLANFLKEHYPEINLHASTQMTVHNLQGTQDLLSNGFSRIVLSRELPIDEIKHIKENISGEIEVFVHGALCISYSGQCLLSSAIGGRSGNRGLCAQPCRLPYELTNIDTNQIIDKGYLLSPRDLCSIEYLPYLIKAGVDSFKIEGRLKSPTYVGTITRIYRKYINLIMENINLSEEDLVKLVRENLNLKNEDSKLSDMEELTQSFNRGGFSKGHLDSSGNNNLIFKEKPNNMGIYLGEIYHFNSNKGHVSFKLESPLSIGDKISINNESYTVSELMIKNKNYQELDTGAIVTIGRMKGNIKPKQKIYKIENVNLNKKIMPSFKEDKNLKKIKINGTIIIKENESIQLKLSSNEIFYNNLDYTYISDIVPEQSQNKPITKEIIIDKLSKTGSTQFEFESIDVILDNNLFITISSLNEIRRQALLEFEHLCIQKHNHNIIYNNDANLTILSKTNKDFSNKTISLLLNILNEDYDYTKLNNISRIYIPFKYFINSKYENILNNICNKFNTYIYMPHIIRDNKLDLINNNINSILTKYEIKGLVISHISQINLLKEYNLELIGNYNLNVFNNSSINTLENLNIKHITMSSELDRNEINDLNNKTNIPTELIVYGRLPVMTNNYCYLGKLNKCSDKCKSKDCISNKKYALKDRMGFLFPILPDNTFNQTTIFNSKITSITYDDININSVRIDILHESLDDIQNIIETVQSGNRFEGKDYTNGKTATLS